MDRRKTQLSKKKMTQLNTSTGSKKTQLATQYGPKKNSTTCQATATSQLGAPPWQEATVELESLAKPSRRKRHLKRRQTSKSSMRQQGRYHAQRGAVEAPAQKVPPP
jgi:hypothetical protein